MLQYVARRLLAMIPTLLGITFITFLMINLAPGDPVAIAAGGAGGEGAGSATETAGKVVKTKKQLLGILAKDFNVHVWDAPGGAFAAPSGEALERWRAPHLEEPERVGAFPDWAHALALDASGALLVGTEAGDVVRMDLSGGERRAFDGMTRAVWAVAAAPDGSAVAAADVDGRILVFDAASGAVRCDVPGHGKPVRDLVFAGDLVVSASDDGVVRAHDAATGAAVAERHTVSGIVAALAVSADGRRLWSAGQDRKVREHDPRTLEIVREGMPHGAMVNDLALAPDGRRLVTASDDRLVRVFDVDAPDAPPAELRGHYKEVTAVAVSADGGTVWSGGRDETLRTWDVASGVQRAQSPEAVGKVWSIVVAPGGAKAASASESWVKNPIWKRYLTWLWRTVRLDFGRSLTDERLVLEKVAEALPVTLGLNALAIVIIYLVSIPLGVEAAVRRARPFDTGSSLLVFVLYSMPGFWVATMLIMQFSSERAWNVLPSVGLHDPFQEDLSYFAWLKDWALHLVLPITAATYGGLATMSRFARTSMLETISQDYVRTARAKGLPEKTVIYRHAFKNSLIPIVTLLGGLLPGLIGGSVIIEQIFSIHGMGWLGFEAIGERDYPVIMAVTTLSAVLVLFGVLLSDILYTLVDPRITHS